MRPALALVARAIQWLKSNDRVGTYVVGIKYANVSATEMDHQKAELQEGGIVDAETWFLKLLSFSRGATAAPLF